MKKINKKMNSASSFRIGDRWVGAGQPTYFIAEISANHNHGYDHTKKLIRAAKEAGADAVKVQTYTPDTITLDSKKKYFRIQGGTLWDGRSLYDLYRETFMPWQWQPKLKKYADSLGIQLFSSAFDPSSVDFLEAMDVPVYKVASFELVDIPLIQKIAQTKKPVILSTGMATSQEIDQACQTARKGGAQGVAILKCTSAYPAPIDEMNLRTIPDMIRRWRIPVGLSDHSLGTHIPIAAVVLGASLIEKHITLSRDQKGPDSAFSLEPHEFQTMIERVRDIEKAMGRVHYGVTEHESKTCRFRRSIFAVADIHKGEAFSPQNTRSIRPGQGLLPKYLPQLLGRKAARKIGKGTPLTWTLVQGGKFGA